LSNDELYSVKNLGFIGDFLQNSKLEGAKSLAFRIFFENEERVDQKIKKGYAESVVGYIISKEEIESRLWKAPGIPAIKEPSWDEWQASIQKRFNSKYAERTILDAQIRWYTFNKEWMPLIEYTTAKFEKYGIDTFAESKDALNDQLWNAFFLHCSNKHTLNKAITWARLLVNNDIANPHYADTYANLLYKTGRIKEGIKWEKMAIMLDQKLAVIYETQPDPVYPLTVKRMEQNEKIWLQ
jgi:hypothetical protein